MKSVIIGTAGHIDHGKTALVKALTGIDADRLEEEKRRGITIDIGFAHLELPTPTGETLRLGFVDVPGHERFIRNMLAGIGGIDLVLFVIAADESIKPQTREHFDICRLLGIQRGLTVITKSDTVDTETLGVVKLEIAEFLRGSFLDPSSASMLAVSSLTGAGIDQLKQELIEIAGEVAPRDSSALARLPIDRVFTMKGFGTVVTGTLLEGTIRKDTELEVFPRGKRVRVRGVQVHGKSADESTAGLRTALNVVGAEKDELERGMVLAPPAILHSTFRADVSLSLLTSAKLLRNRARVHFHVHTSETVAEIFLNGKKQIASGETQFAQLRLADPLLLLPGDHFIVRQFSPVITIGGGIVLDSSPQPKTPKTGHEAFLEILANGDPASVLNARITRRGSRGLSLSQIVSETGWPPEFIEKHLKNIGVVGSNALFLTESALESLKLSFIAALSDFHAHNPLVGGIGREALRESLNVGPEIFALALAALAKEKKIEVNGEQVRLTGKSVVMKDDEAESKKVIENAFATAGLTVPALKDVLAGLKIDRIRAQKIMTLLLRDKVLIKVSEDLVFHQAALEKLRKLLVSEKAKSPKLDIARFKDLTAVSRKYAIPLLEYLDREHITKRAGNERVIL